MNYVTAQGTSKAVGTGITPNMQHYAFDVYFPLYVKVFHESTAVTRSAEQQCLSV